MGDSQRDGGCVCLDFDFLQLRGVAGIGDVGKKRKCHIFAILRQRYGKTGDLEKTQKRGSGKNAKSTPPVFVILTIEVLYQFFAVVSEFVVCFFEE